MDLYKKIIEEELTMKKIVYFFAAVLGLCYLCTFIFFVFIGPNQPDYEKWPTVEYIYTAPDREEYIPEDRFCGCDWDFDGYKKEVDISPRMMTVLLEKTTDLTLNVIYPKQPEQIIVKAFSNGDFPENAEEKNITEDSKHFSISPGYTYLFELRYGEEYVTYALRCEFV